MGKHTGAPWIIIKNNIADDFSEWCEDVHAMGTVQDVVEFLYQKGYIKGKKWLKYIDSIEVPMFWFTEVMEPMREGFIPPKAWIGKKG